MAWHIGNTTVRTPYRLRAALVALQSSHLQGHLLGSESEQAFADLLHDKGLVQAARSRVEDRSDLGRKWRVALGQLGFLASHLTRGHRDGVDQKLETMVAGIPGLTGRPYEITHAGRRLLDADEVITQQEAFLRSLLAYRIPSPLERRYKHRQFSPLHFTLDVLKHLTALGLEPFISFEEMALVVQRSNPDDGAAKAAERIRMLRAARDSARVPALQLYRQAYQEAVLEDDPKIDPQRISIRINTLNDYADLNLRYLKATGLFKGRGRGIAVPPVQRQVAQRLTDEPLPLLDEASYLRQLWNGARLPTDDRPTVLAVTQSLEEAVRQMGEEAEPLDIELLDDEHLQLARRRLEARLHRLSEKEFARGQVEQVEEIVGLLDAIPSRRRKTLSDGSVVSIPRTEASVYFEWAIWRAFLAIDSLENEPWDARRFEIDQDLLPVGHAPGGGPDMSFIFEDAIVVVEVTLTSSSRQEAAEGEPVRRHVARYAEENTTDKTVYGLFYRSSC